jgi:hypothetical protein
LVTAALLALTLVVAFAAIGQNRPSREDAARHPPALIRALHDTPGEVEDELVVEVVFTPDQLPAGDAQAIFYRVTLPAGTSLPALAGPYSLKRSDVIAAGVGIEVVQSGTYSLQLETPLRVQRHAASGVEEIAAEREVLLGPGDAAIYPDYTGQGTIRNTGQEPVVVLGMGIVSTEATGIAVPQLPKGVETKLLISSSTMDWGSLPSGPVAMSLWRLWLPTGASVGPYAGAGLEALWIERGAISRRFLRLPESIPSLQPLVHFAGTPAGFMGPAPGTRRSIASEHNEPAVLLALSIEPEAIWSATLAP